MLSERSSRNMAFMPSSGLRHCKPANASTSEVMMTTRNTKAMPRRHLLTGMPPGLVHADVVRVTEIAQGAACVAVAAQPRAVRGEHLDAVIARVGHIKPVLRVHAQTLGAVEIAVLGPVVADDLFEMFVLAR